MEISLGEMQNICEGEFILLCGVAGKKKWKWNKTKQNSVNILQVLPSTKLRGGIKGTILGCALADPGEVKQYMSALL